MYPSHQRRSVGHARRSKHTVTFPLTTAGIVHRAKCELLRQYTTDTTASKILKYSTDKLEALYKMPGQVKTQYFIRSLSNKLEITVNASTAKTSKHYKHCNTSQRFSFY